MKLVIQPIGYRRNGLPIWPIAGGDGTDEGDVSPAGTPDPSADLEAQLAQTPADVRRSPEFQALERQARANARQAGTALRQAAQARTEAEQARQAAEAERSRAMEEQVTGILGAEGLQAWQEISALSESDPVGAATRFRELIGSAQTAAATAPPEGEPTPATSQAGGQTVPNTGTPSMPGGGVGDAPFGAAATTQDDEDTRIRALEKTFDDVVERNKREPNRVRMRDRADGLMAFLEASYMKGLRAAGRSPVRR